MCVCVFLGPLLTFFSFSFDLGLNIFLCTGLLGVYVLEASWLTFYDYYVAFVCSVLLYVSIYKQSLSLGLIYSLNFTRIWPLKRILSL